MIGVRSNPSAAAGPLEDAWITSYQKAPSLLHWTLPIAISRVSLLDASRLDIEMSAMLKEQLVKVFSLMKPGMLFQYEAERDAFLEFLIWRFSIWVGKPTPGNALMNLRYRDDRAMEIRIKGLEGLGLTVAQKMWYCIAMVGGQYIWAHLQSFSAFLRWEAIGMASLGFDATYIRDLRGCIIWQPTHISLHREEMLLLLLPLNSSTIILHPFSKHKSSNSSEDDATCPICWVLLLLP